METSVLDALNDIGYAGPLLKPEALNQAIQGGPKNVEYTGVVHQLAEELRVLRSLEEQVNATQSPDDASSFLLELSSFLKELGCPYTRLITGHMSSRLQSPEDRTLLLEYLLSELMTARMCFIKDGPESNSTMDIKIQETETARDLKELLIALKFNKPPPDITPELLFSKVEARLKEILQKESPDYVGKPLYNKAISEKQWKELDGIYKRLCDEYRMRREMLITRLDCTIQSFEWSGKGGEKREEIQSIYRPLRSKMNVAPSVKLSDVLAARSSMLTLRKTSDAAVRINTKSQVNKVMIGKVPDRGGRPSEQEPPPPEMPSWQQQRSQGGGGGGGGGGRGGGRGGFGGGSRVQGGWNPNQGNNRSDGNFSGYDANRGQNDFQDNRNFSHNRGNDNYRSNPYQDGRGGQNGSQGQNYQQNQGYRNYNQNQGYQTQNYNQDYQNYNANYQNQGYSGQQGQGKGHYQNEHDDRSNNYNRNNSGGRGRSNYNRGGRY